MTSTISRQHISASEWKRLFLEAVHNAKSVEVVNEWVDMNAYALRDIERAYPDSYKFIQDQLNTARGNLLHAPQED